MNNSLNAKIIAVMLVSFLVVLMFWDCIFRDFFFGSIYEDATYLEIGVGYGLMGFLYIILVLFLNKKFTREDESSEY